MRTLFYAGSLAVPIVLLGCEGADPANAIIGSKDTAEHVSAKMQMKGLADALRAEELSSGEWPVSLDVLAVDGQIRESDLEDPWGNDYVYAPPASRDEKPTLYSFGPDGESDTPDDVHHEWR